MRETICPHCKKPIYDEEALLCHFCGGSLQRPSRGALGQLRHHSKIYLTVLAIVMILAFLALLIR